MAKILRTFVKGKKFTYSGSVAAGTTICYGTSGSKIHVLREDYGALLDEFRGGMVKLGTSWTSPPCGSVGAWLRENVSSTGTASYVGPILLEEGYAERVSGATSEIRFK